MSELKPCPFCGGEAKWYYHGTTEGGFVLCTKCEASTNIFDEQHNEEDCKAVAFEAWNRRVGDTNE
mgnify:CR=1 FL=1